MLLVEARRPARVDADGRFVPLADHDRSRWDRAAVAEGASILDAAVGSGPVGEYQLQAAIAAVHDRAPSATAPTGGTSSPLYGLLEQVTGNPVVTLNRAVATAMAEGPDAGLALVAEVEPQLPGHPRLLAVRGHLHELAAAPTRRTPISGPPPSAPATVASATTCSGRPPGSGPGDQPLLRPPPAGPASSSDDSISRRWTGTRCASRSGQLDRRRRCRCRRRPRRSCQT